MKNTYEEYRKISSLISLAHEELYLQWEHSQDKRLETAETMTTYQISFLLELVDGYMLGKMEFMEEPA